MQIIDVVQGTPEWHIARAGKVTASRICDVLAQGRKKGEESVTRRNYLYQLVAERMIGKPVPETYKNGHMERGNELEKYARTEYWMRTDTEVEQVGFVLHDTLENYGCSPDGVTSKVSGIQIKCPIIAIHCQYLQANVVPVEYVPQMQSEMDTMGWEYSDFVSYCEHLPSPLNLFVKRMYRNEQRIAEITQEVIKFNAEVDQTIAKLRALGGE